MALFQSDLKDAIKRLNNKEFGSPEERDQLIAQIRSADGIKARVRLSEIGRTLIEMPRYWFTIGRSMLIGI